MIVIKLGGSLATAGTLEDCLTTIDRKFAGRPVVVVPGGGQFADQVRASQQQWRFDDATAHRMALLAMQQMALLFHGLKPDWPIAGRVADLQNQPATLIWSPIPEELDQAGVPASWDITSDSLAAWLAGRLSADELILVKSAPVETGVELSELAANRIIDTAFCAFAAAGRFKITIMKQQVFNG